MVIATTPSIYIILLQTLLDLESWHQDLSFGTLCHPQAAISTTLQSLEAGSCMFRFGAISCILVLLCGDIALTPSIRIILWKNLRDLESWHWDFSFTTPCCPQASILMTLQSLEAVGQIFRFGAISCILVLLHGNRRHVHNTPYFTVKPAPSGKLTLISFI